MIPHQTPKSAAQSIGRCREMVRQIAIPQQRCTLFFGGGDFQQILEMTMRVMF